MKVKFPKLRTAGVVLFVVVILGLFAYIFTASPFQSTYDPDVSRFSANSIDVSMANGTTKHETPTVYAPGTPSKTELLFPPSAEDLTRLSGD